MFYVYVQHLRTKENLWFVGASSLFIIQSLYSSLKMFILSLYHPSFLYVIYSTRLCGKFNNVVWINLSFKPVYFSVKQIHPSAQVTFIQPRSLDNQREVLRMHDTQHSAYRQTSLITRPPTTADLTLYKSYF